MSDSGRIIIRPLHAGDVGQLHAVLDLVARERRYLTFLEAPEPDDFRTYILSEQARGAPQFVAADGSRIVGWCDIGRQFFPSHAHRGSVGMGILPEFRGRGIGARLLGAAIGDASQKGFLRIELSVRTDNERAIRLYRRLGFHEEGISRRAVRIADAFFDSLNMALLIE